MDALASPKRASFLQEAHAMLHKHWGPLWKDDEASGKRLERLLADAEAYGLSERSDLLRYFNCAAALGDDFPAQHAWAGRLLRNTALQPGVRMALLAERAQQYLNGYHVS